ncbi:MAG: hypothetical protein IIY74_05750 [Firmicutes bacterium]|nr:hypothetical protein [Bacillota bacterium]MBQ1525026.1 hypothetical protein [Bacillota bacterium]
MLKIAVADEKEKYELGELAKMFLPQSRFEMSFEEGFAEGADLVVPKDGTKNDRKRVLYRYLSDLTGQSLDWGILTGVRPGKLYNDLFRAKGREEA